MSVPATSIPLLEDLQTSVIGVDPQDKARALAVLESTPVPTTRMEAWKYTRVAKLAKLTLKNRSETLSSIDSYLPNASAPRLVFVNGHFQPELSVLPNNPGIEIQALDRISSLAPQHHPLEGEFFNALNTAYLDGGCQISIAPNAVITEKIQLVHVLKGSEVISNFRIIINVGRNASAGLTHSFFSENNESGFCNARCEVVLDENAQLTINKIQYEGSGSFHISGEWVEQARDSSFTMNTVTLNGGLVRNNVHVHVNGQNCTTNLHGAYLLKDQQHVDNHTVIDHRVANCASNELYKGVVDDKGTAVFNGKVFVRPDAQKINAFQSNGNVLISESASVNSKPELEIYADDVKCSHGSTTGQLDEEAIFYLRARGVSEKAARQLMVSAFVDDVLEKIEDERVLSFVHRLLHERFGWEFNL